ncbi:MAG TPA: class I SAM-dependent methyltransferase [Longimicrobium sp.]|jgi:2-polyprenyl-3-methyl-5-hydroxy-6-metoxy-1,4-benzoquinol methylase
MDASMTDDLCPLCASPSVRPHAETRTARYLRCAVCELTFMAPEDRPSADAERAHYGTHENDAADPGYRAFLDRLAAPLAERLLPGAEGLDYGCGPGPTLSRMMEERGFSVALHDPFFVPNPAALLREYDFVTASEVAEHFFHPGAEFQRLDRLLRPGGWLGIMTELARDDREFAQWRYARDPTHVVFYRETTLSWIADRFGWRLHLPARNVALFHKPEPSSG